MRNLSNPQFDGPLAQAVEAVEAGAAGPAYVNRCGYVVESYCPREPRERRTLLPVYSYTGPAGLGEIVTCRGMGTRQWRVVAVAFGYPGRMRIMHSEEAASC